MRSAVQPLGQSLARHELHDEIEGAVGFFQSVNRGDVGMIQRREELRFSPEPIDAQLIVCERFGQDLDGDVALELPIARGVNLAHAACAKQAQDPIRADRRSCQRRSSHVIRPVPP